MSRVEPGQTGKDLGLVLRLLRQWREWTQAELAQRTGISLVQIGKLEREEIGRPHPKTWQRLRGGTGLQREAVPTVAPRLRALEAATHKQLERVVVEDRDRPRDPGPYEIFGATF